MIKCPLIGNNIATASRTKRNNEKQRLFLLNQEIIFGLTRLVRTQSDPKVMRIEIRDNKNTNFDLLLKQSRFKCFKLLRPDEQRFGEVRAFGIG